MAASSSSDTGRTTTRSKTEEADTDTEADTPKSGKGEGKPREAQVGVDVSPEGVPYQAPSRPREEMEAVNPENPNPERTKIERQIEDLQAQLERHDENSEENVGLKTGTAPSNSGTSPNK